ncbi:unnamed protein product [Effrenium voratum]|uniref:Uncharacterized protein n=1 Tax=Effrenium voratum TaxID=2562239 RepID=A0AA36MPK0_9DINO|nr:unnamed protein product [Effrenium voratum]
MDELLEFLKELPCQLCEEQPVERRLLMELGLARSTAALRADSDPESLEDLRLAEKAQEELVRHRRHTPFFKVVARDASGDGSSFLSVFDGKTRYHLGVSSFDPRGGFFVHPSKEAASQSVSAFPRQSAAWGVRRAERGVGQWARGHGRGGSAGPVFLPTTLEKAKGEAEIYK